MTPDSVEGLTAEPEADPTASDGRFVRHWRIAQFAPLAEGNEQAGYDLPKPSTAWRALAAERNGLVNISRVYGLPVARPGRTATWLKTTSSSRSQSKKAAIGWSREVWVFVNGQRVYADKNLYLPPDARKVPDGRLSLLQNGSLVLPLNAGDNEVAIAIANNFFGWV